MDFSIFPNEFLLDFISRNSLMRNLVLPDPILLPSIARNVYNTNCKNGKIPTANFNLASNMALGDFFAQHNVRAGGPRPILVERAERLYNDLLENNCNSLMELKFNKMTSDELLEFLELYNWRSRVSNPNDYVELVNLAADLYFDIKNQGSHMPITWALADLIIAQKPINAPYRYTGCQINDMGQDEIRVFASVLGLDPNAQNAKFRIYRILRMMDLIDEEKQLQSK